MQSWSLRRHEGSAFEKLALRRAADIGDFFDRADPRRQWRQPPGLDEAGSLCSGRVSSANKNGADCQQHRLSETD
jgi:hypothetical protein